MQNQHSVVGVRGRNLAVPKDAPHLAPRQLVGRGQCVVRQDTGRGRSKEALCVAAGTRGERPGFLEKGGPRGGVIDKEDDAVRRQASHQGGDGSQAHVGSNTVFVKRNDQEFGSGAFIVKGSHVGICKLLLAVRIVASMLSFSQCRTVLMKVYGQVK